MFWGACIHHVTSPVVPCYPLWPLWHPVTPCGPLLEPCQYLKPIKSYLVIDVQNIYDLWQGQGITGVTGDNMGPLVRSHDDYRHPRTCKLSLISWYVSILKIYGETHGQFWVAINQAIKLAKVHEILIHWWQIGWLQCIKISWTLYMNCALYNC